MTLTQAHPTDHRVILDDVSWDLYERMLEEIGDGHVRLTYDEGRLQIMSPGPTHERVKKVIARLIEAYSDEVGIAAEGFGSTTFRRKDLKKGLEPDECYYIQNHDAMLAKDELDLTIDPPPDLAVEIDISPPGVARQPIYGAAGCAGNLALRRHPDHLTSPLERWELFCFAEEPLLSRSTDERCQRTCADCAVEGSA